MNDSAPRRKPGHHRRLAAVLLAFALGPAPAADAQAPAPRFGGPIAVFFPPDVPPLGSARSAAAAGASSSPAPPGLAPYVYDPFYAPLGTLLARDGTDAELQFRLEAYQASKGALLTELRAKLATTLKEPDPAVRQRTLEDFAREQTPRIAELEAAAEQIRHDLCRSRSAQREFLRWQVDFAAETPPPDADRAVRFREVVRMELYFRDGLLPDQRRLLREVAQGGTAGNGWFEFSPAPALVHLPANVPPDLAVKIEAYARENFALQSELLATLHPTLKTPADPGHALALRALAAAQAPRLAALEGAAEDIRRGLAVLQDPARSPELPPVSPELSKRIAAHRLGTLALQKELLARVDAVKKAAAGDPALGDRIRQAIAAFTQENAARYAALDRSRDAIHAELARVPAAGGTGASADALRKNFTESLRQLQSYWDYREYQTAVFQPGLSAEQRRLLFDGALQKLALPLPGAEIDPGRR